MLSLLVTAGVSDLFGVTSKELDACSVGLHVVMYCLVKSVVCPDAALRYITELFVLHRFYCTVAQQWSESKCLR